MRKKIGKLFIRIETGNIECLAYNPETQDYYQMVQKTINNGYRQIICTSSLMISIIEHYLVYHNAELSNIEFLQEEDELNNEIREIIRRLRDNGAYWAILKERLEFLSKYDSIDIKQVVFKCIEGDGYIIDVRVNGLISISEHMYESASDEIVGIAKGVLY